MERNTLLTTRFGGSEKKEFVAFNYIAELQEATAEISGNGDCDFSWEPDYLPDGQTQWQCFFYPTDDNPIQDLIRKLIALTSGGDFHLWVFRSTDDGDHRSLLQKFEGGTCTHESPMLPGSLGIDGSIAAAELEDGCDVNAALLLAEILHEACDEGWYQSCEDDGDAVGGGWDEDDLSCLCNANLAAVVLANAFQLWPALLSDSSIQGRVAEMNRNLDKVIVGILDFDPFDYTEGSEMILPRLKAVLESALLQQCTPQKSRRKAGEFTTCRI
jgi:hypothetical protein